jgi:signal transduction histidine kinase
VVNKIRGLLSRRELQFEPYDINAVAYDVVRLVDSDATLRGIQLWSQLGPVPLVHGDRLHLQQVLLNLLMNGMDSMEGMPVGQRHLTLTTASTDTGDAQITVTDTGRGIDKADLPRLFNSFFTTKANGMGLGLALCRSIVQAHGGNISAHNNPDGGASFAITLPIDATQRAH